MIKIKQNHTWIFAFTDLAFLLLISLSLIPSTPGNISIHLSEMDVPVVPSNPNLSPVHQSHDLWELHVYGKSEYHPTPFRLINVGFDQSASTNMYSKDVGADELISELESLKELNVRPVLLLEKTSFSQDFLFAAGSIARVWASVKSHTIVQPVDPERQ